jgi:protocatechuate 3,4-dioxygenase beta subunit
MNTSRWILVTLILSLVPAALSPAQQEAETPDAEKAAIVFRVVDAASDAPIAGAEVGVWNEASERLVAKTDAKGFARLAVAPGWFLAFVTAEKWTGQEQDEVWLDESDEETLEFRLEPGVPFDGRVVGPEGDPVEGAWVAVTAGGAYEGAVFASLQGDRFFARIQTDAEGRFHVAGIPPGAIATVTAWAEAYLAAEAGVKAIGETVRPSPLVLRLDRGGVIRGMVRDPEGRPVAGAIVYVIPAEADWLRESPDMVAVSSDGGSDSSASVLSDADGSFLHGGLPIDTELVAFAVAEGFARSGESPVLRLSEEKPEREVALNLRPPATIVLRLKDTSGEQVRDATIALGRSVFSPEIDEADESGVYRFEGLSAGSHFVRIEGRRSRFLEQRFEVEVDIGETKEVDVTLDPGVAIEGTLVDPEGKPREDAYLRAYRVNPDREKWQPGEYRQTDVGEGGKFTLSGLRPGKYSLVLLDDGFDVLEKVVVEAPAKDFVLRGVYLGIARVRLETPDGQPYSGKTYEWTVRDGGAGGGGGEAVDGVVEFHGFRGETRREEIQIEGYVHVILEVTADPGEEIDLGTVVLDPGVTLEGKAVDVEGKPVRGAVVSFGGYAPYTEATSGVDGSFSLEHVPEGPIEVTIDTEGFLDASATVDAAKPTKIVLHRGALLRGIVTTKDGARSGEAWLEVRRPDPDEPGEWIYDETIHVQDDGTFELRLAAGVCRIEDRVEDERYVTLAELELVEGETRQVELVVGE